MYSPRIAYGDELAGESDAPALQRAAYTVASNVADDAAARDADSPFDSPYAHLLDIQREYIANTPGCLLPPTRVHDCVRDRICRHRRLHVAVIRRRRVASFDFRVRTDEYEYHTCIGGICRHLNPHHACDMGAACWHRSAPSRIDVFVYPSLFVCTRTGRVHACGTMCTHRHADLADGGLYVCALTGIQLGAQLAGPYDHMQFFSMAGGDAPKALEDGCADNDADDDDDAAREPGAELVVAEGAYSTEPARLMLAPAPQGYPAQTTQGERRLRRTLVEQAVQKELRGVLPGRKGVLERSMRPVTVFYANQKNTGKSLLDLYFAACAVRPHPFHPAWRGFRLRKPLVDPTWAKITKLFPPPGATESDSDSVAIVADTVALYEALERQDILAEIKPEKAVQALLAIMRDGIESPQGRIVTARGFGWYDSKAASVRTQITERILAKSRAGTLDPLE